MKALISGAAGFVGKHLIAHLQESGWNVTATKLPSETFNAALPVYDLDILEKNAVKSLLASISPDCVFHLTAQSSVALSWQNPALTIDVNIHGTLNMLEAIREMPKPPRVLLIGSGEEYGYVLPEELPIGEDTALRPGNIYAATKIMQGMLGQIYARAYGLEMIITRSFNHMGPGQSDIFVLPNFCKQVAFIESGLAAPILHVGNLEAKRDFTDVRDIVRAYRLLAEKGENGQIYNVGSGKAISVGDVLNVILSLSTVAISVEQDLSRMRPSDTPVIQADTLRLNERTGWKPQIPIKTTLNDMLDEWRNITATEGRR